MKDMVAERRRVEKLKKRLDARKKFSEAASRGAAGRAKRAVETCRKNGSYEGREHYRKYEIDTQAESKGEK